MIVWLFIVITVIFCFFPVNTIALTKPEKAKMVEGMLIQMAQSGQIQSKVCMLLCSRLLRHVIDVIHICFIILVITQKVLIILHFLVFLDH